jgi:GNAT superfamily N-acetyltransferase
MESISIRSAHNEDLPRITELAGQLGYPSSEEELRVRLTRVLGATLHAAWVAEHEGAEGPEIVGWMHCFIDLRLESDARAEIGGLVVDEAWRGKGIGSRFVTKAENWARQRGVQALRVRSNVIRERSHQLYLRLGFTETKRQAVFDKELGK